MTAAVREALGCHLARLSEGRISRDQIDPAASLLDRGYLDSLSAAAFLALIEDEYGVSVSEVDLLGPLRSLDDLARHVQAEGRT